LPAENNDADHRCGNKAGVAKQEQTVATKDTEQRTLQVAGSIPAFFMPIREIANPQKSNNKKIPSVNQQTIWMIIHTIGYISAKVWWL